MFHGKYSIGYTLIELMVAFTLSFLIISMVVEIYLIANKNQQMQITLIALKDNEQMTNQILTSAIRRAGYALCTKLSDDFPFYNHSTLTFDFKNTIQPFYTPEMKPGTDGITVWNANHKYATVAKNMRGHATLYANRLVTFSADDLVMISDCKTIEIFQIKHVSIVNGLQKIIPASPLQQLYQVNAELSKLQIISYFVAKTNRFDGRHRPVYALFEKNLAGMNSELVEGVDDMQIEYDAAGLSFTLNGISTTNINFVKKWYLYVALS